MTYEENLRKRKELKEDLDHFIEIVHLVKDRRIKEIFKMYAEETLKQLENL